MVSMLVKEQALALKARSRHHTLIKGDEAVLQKHTSISSVQMPSLLIWCTLCGLYGLRGQRLLPSHYVSVMAVK